MTNARKQEKSKGKTARVPFSGPKLKLQMSKEDRKLFKDRKMVPRWFNNDGGRIERALGGGYNYVKPEYAGSLGQGALHMDGKDPESNLRVSQVANRSDPITRAYLMEISEKFYKEDQAAKEVVNAKVDEALALGGERGSDIENEYRPT
jgi:hypothetical protein